MRRLGKLLLALILLGIILTALSGLYEDWLWFKDLGYPQLFWTPLLSKWLIQIVNGTILFLFIAGTLLSIRHAIVTFINERLRRRFRLVQNMNEPAFSLNQRHVTLWLVLLAALISFAVSFVAGFTGWLEVLSFMKATPFGKTDPIFGRDLSFYFFRLPFLRTVYNIFFGPLFLLTFFTALFYMVTGVLRFHSLKLWHPGAITVSPAARKHLALLCAILFLLKAFGYYLDTFQLLYSRHGHVVGAGYADLNASLPALRILLVLALIGFAAAALTLLFKDVRLLSLPVITVFLLNILLYGFYPTLIQNLVVIPNELQMEAPYIQHEISLTRYGYGLDKIKEENYPATTPITPTVLKADQATLNNIRLNDSRPLLQTYAQQQGIRLYYKFPAIDVDRYTVNGEYRQLMIAPRELSVSDLDPKAQTFVNTRFKYTHGYGVAASFANAVTSDGLPSYAIKDVPPVTPYAALRLTQPRIYYGQQTNHWVVVDTTTKEFDYPYGSANVENTYQGKTGIPFTPLNKLMLSLHEGTLRFYLAGEITAHSRILLHRNIMDRVEKLAPFLTYDQDPYIVIDHGRLKWIIDAYTTSDSLPYSSQYPGQDFNYIRNSVKVVVDAYDGTVDFYAMDPHDPVLETYRKIFPGVFKDLSQMPKSLVAHLRYPETLFTVQSNMLRNFHMTDVSVFYNKEDAWDIAKELYTSKAQYVKPYYTIMKLPGASKPEFILMLPFTPASSANNTRNNMVAWLAARMDGTHYGHLLLYELPKNIDINGPLQIESQIDQDPNISKQLSLWDQKGSRVIRGNLLVIPIGGNFLYVEPIYLESDKGGSIPEMKRVILAYNNSLVMADTLGSALTQVFGSSAPQPTTPGQSTAPPPSPSVVSPSTPSGTDINSILSQIDQLRTLLDNLESRLKALQTPPVSSSASSAASPATSATASSTSSVPSSTSSLSHPTSSTPPRPS
ncbi:UPF0182 protein <locus_tag_ [Acididesulfobacillus acetoxydans]|uniref:UPF0182 protein DEACI_2539 n=1 Tax=Acididesulfobacillus acetoxydans TaxID=1561005 RepID=A0A8S0W8K1_9FIRM|nr:UPF0182 family protein [Acididesulfobacillus acetoxydans]CAA7601869.1 UPF0182 protein <locus_tag> [Acididesulfobacillus acetoxydans]CEJ08287.1 UPF0182 protein DSY1630 [Acididesulfobacillus acetoxydans]